MWSAFQIPFRIGFGYENDDLTPAAHAFDFIIEIWFLCDIFVNFRLGYFDPDTGDLIMDITAIRRHYLSSWFAVDAISSIPTNACRARDPQLLRPALP